LIEDPFEAQALVAGVRDGRIDFAADLRLRACCEGLAIPTTPTETVDSAGWSRNRAER
jgi:hypothetical protein